MRVLGGASRWRVHTSARLEFLRFSGSLRTPHYCLAFPFLSLPPSLLPSLLLFFFAERASSHPSLTRPASTVMYVMMMMMMMHLRLLIDRARPWRTGCINWPSGSLCRFSEVGVASALLTNIEAWQEKGQTRPSRIPLPTCGCALGIYERSSNVILSVLRRLGVSTCRFLPLACLFAQWMLVINPQPPDTLRPPERP